jgi:cell division protein FtsL
MNTLLVIGIILMFSGLLLVLISEIMIAHYDRKLYKLNQVERRQNEQNRNNWQNKKRNEKIF